MDQELQKQLIKQLKILNFWIRFFGGIALVSMALIGFLLFKAVTFIKETNSKVQETSEQLNVQQQVCEGEGTFSEFIRNSTSACSEQ